MFDIVRLGGKRMSFKRVLSLICIFFVLIAVIGPFFGMNLTGGSQYYTTEEQEWLDINRDRTFKVRSYNSHINLSKETGKKVQLKAVFDLIEKSSGIQFDIVEGNSDTSKEQQDVDLIVGVKTLDKDRITTSALYSKKYWVCSYSNYQSINNLIGQNIGFIKEDSKYNEFLSLYSGNNNRIQLLEINELFESLSNKEIDAIIVADCPNINYLLYSYDVKRNFEVKNIKSDITISGSKDLSILIQIIDTIINQNRNKIDEIINEKNIREIKALIELTEEEWQTLENIKKLKVGFIRNLLPYDYKRETDIYGISAELVKYIASVLEVPLEYIPYDDYEQLEADIAKGRIHMATSYGMYTYYVPEGFSVSLPYSTNRIGTASNVDSDLSANTLYDLNGYRIALVKDSWQEEMLIKNGITYTPVYVKTIHEALTKIDLDDADFAIEGIWILTYLLKEISRENDRISGEIKVGSSRHLLLNKDQVALRKFSNDIIAMVNLKKYENIGLQADYYIKSPYNFYESITTILFLTLCFIGIFIVLLINKLNIERKKAEGENKSKGEFLAKMSHEIRTPLTAIMGYINLLSTSSNLSGKEKEQLKIAYNSSNILINLINDILDFSKIEAGKVNIVNKEFNLRLMIDNTINIIGIMAEQKKLDFVVNLHQNLPAFIIGDERRLEQVLINVLSNAIKFTNKGFVEIDVSAEYYDDIVRLDFIVQDTGKGMGEDVITCIFEAFQQEDNSISRNHGGTGLGLYISKEFIERMHGKIEVESWIGKGTKFSFYTIHELTTRTAVEELETLQITIKELIGMKVLLVEDNDINQMVIKDILAEIGLKVVIAKDGKEAVEVVSKEFDFVLMDIQMPVMDGIMAVGIMKKNEDLMGVPIIALTANVMPEQVDSYYEAGFDAYCSKPIVINELSQTLIEMYEKYHM